MPGQRNTQEEGGQGGFDPISGRDDDKPIIEDKEMTEEEKEIEAERLYHLIERLSATGIIKPVFQSS